MNEKNNIESVLYNSDLFNIIYELVPFHTRVFLFKINKYFRCNIKRIMCVMCKEKICCPIVFENSLYCYKCLDEYKIIQNDKKFWKSCEKIEKKYVYCKYCNIKCADFEFLHYHIEFKCKYFQPVMVKRQNALGVYYLDHFI